MKNSKGIVLLATFFAMHNGFAVDPGFEIYNKASQPIVIALLINGQLTEATVGANQTFEKAVDLKSPIRLAVADQKAKKTQSPFFAGALVPQPNNMYDLKASGKAKYVMWDPAKAPYLFPQTGQSGKTKSGYSLRNNLKQSETLPVSTAVLPVQSTPVQPTVVPTAVRPGKPLPEVPSTKLVKPVAQVPAAPAAPVKPVVTPGLKGVGGKVGPRPGQPLVADPRLIDIDRDPGLASPVKPVPSIPSKPSIITPEQPIKPVITPGLRDLDDRRPLDQGYSPFSGSGTDRDIPSKPSVVTPGLKGVDGKVGPRPGQPLVADPRLIDIDKDAGSNLGVISIDIRKPLSTRPQSAASAPLSNNVMKFIDDNRGIAAKDMDEKWFLQGVSHILNGRLTKQNKNDTEQKLLEIADILVGEPLRNDQTITDDEYARITSNIERRINNFMDKLYVGGMYEIIDKPGVKKQTVVIEPIEPDKKRLSMRPQSAASAPLSNNVMKFIDDNRGIAAKDMDEKWFLQGVGHILNGRLTKQNKNDTEQKLLEIADILVGEPLRNDQTITDDEYARITSNIERRINNFMDKLYVGGMYEIIDK